MALAPNLFTSQVNPSANTEFQDDWSTAQDRYNSAIKDGYEAADAEQLYLDPIKAKWKLAATVPEALRSDFNNDYDKALDHFYQNQQAGYNVDDAAAMSLIPATEKWQTASGVIQPAPKKTSLQQLREADASNTNLQQENDDLTQKVTTGKWKVSDALGEYPAIQSSPYYGPFWRQKAVEEALEDRNADAKSKKPESVEKIGSQLKSLSESEKVEGLPAPAYKAFTNEVNRLTESLPSDDATNTPSIPTPEALQPYVDAVAPASLQLPRPMTQDAFDALPKGTQFVNPSDGKTYRKK